MRRRPLTAARVAVALAAATFAGVGVAYAAGVNVTTGQLWAGSQTLTKGSCNPAESDAELDASNPNANNGNQSSETVLSKKSSDSYVLIGFDLAGSPCSLPTTGGADSAVVTIQVTGTFKGPDTVSAYRITSPWSASTVTWNTMPSYSATADFSFSGTGTKSFAVTGEVDAAIKSGTFYGWMLVDTSGSNNASTTIAGAGSPGIALDYEK